MEINFERLGNIELLKSFLSMHYTQYHFFDGEFAEDPRSDEYRKLSEKLKNKFSDNSTFNIYCDLLGEAIRRGLKSRFCLDPDLIYSDEFRQWETSMKNKPTYIREIEATNFLGDGDISLADDSIMGFDYPVREACKILNGKGYTTYWSSANKEDYLNRIGQVVKDKSVAYILISYESLSDDLKKRLLLDGTCDFCGIAQRHSDNGNFYGIWTEIISGDMLCDTISKELSAKALELPSIVKLREKEDEEQR